ncbi:tRNA threonylcarbamoyl adenosine modification protein YeaZ [Verrucomicrobium sp. GAS474]|uniref:tRNA (adenosine(37)-N6)-threonylcarbamoyltransferase complex dimerization subunit type 1 TsaB n=1 Tax=Verrucomicrobium sp. GAS474 TaxID=1882831 RepID=UPI00087A84A8|nr:tRNA (adenosine(37)-N6)-threonylcarbamoyltransferase complex dimerization subunit type 1 TsaB [Verrucomicrobium sp. GAS474]SDU02096.1 tRNA threonylcarbamoyl adenosine modification protein YeaZ [Verrucomicrobium sp. GAS474]
MILAIDTSSSHGSAALGDAAGNVLQVETFSGQGGRERHSTTLFPALAKFNLRDRPLTKIIVGLGPGSFSGIRVALAAAQGLALPHRTPIVGARSSDSIARQLPHVTRLGVFADARRGEYYCTLYALGTLERESFLLPRDGVEEMASKVTLAVSADPLPMIPEALPPRAADFLHLPHFDLLVPPAGETLEPIYLREPVA